MHPAYRARSAFSLVELSIVLVILGLLVGGVLAGQSLIRAAELRSVSTEYTKYLAAVSSFRDKYFSLPGDMANAQSFWGAEPAANCPGTLSTPSTTIATCNGNGNGQIALASPANQGEESFRFWQHLANAGLIEGTYTGVTATAAADVGAAGVNMPKTKYNSSFAWGWRYVGPMSGNANWFDGDYGNIAQLSLPASSIAIVPADAWNVDTKLDDGNAGTGRVRGMKNAYHPNCTVSAADSGYNVSYTNTACSLEFITGY